MTQDSTAPDPSGVPQTVVAAATKPDVLQMARLTLIGIAGKDGARRALLRSASGAILTVQTGKKTRFGEILAISEAELVLKRSSGPVRLAIGASS